MYSNDIEDLLKKNKIEIGDKIRIEKNNDEFIGTLLPRPDIGDKNTILIKLENGYNIGIAYAKDIKIEKISNIHSTFSFPKAEIKESKDLPKVTLIGTGGTIQSRIDYLTGGVYMLTKPEELLYEIPEISNIANLNIIDLMNIASEDMTYKEWLKIAKAVKEAFDSGARGIVITHGTDTMHFTSAALSFLIQNPKGPVVITGAQRSGDRPSSDAFLNLIGSLYIAANSDIGEVGICMHATSSDEKCNFIRGTKVRKMHTSRRDAFKPINNRPIALVDSKGNIEYKSRYRKIDNSEMKLFEKFEPNIALIYFHPNMDPSIIDYYVEKGYKGIVIAGSGLGHVAVSPSNNSYSWIPHIKNAINNGLIVCVTSQCLYGRVHSKVYRNLRLISETGVTYCEDMLPEVAYVKLGFLLGNYNTENAKALLNKNIVGEITDRSEFDW